MELVRCKREHWEAIMKIRNQNRYGFGDPSLIAVDVHYDYMIRHAGGYMVCCEEDEVIGFIGQVNDDIRVATKKEHQQKGVGKFMVQQFCKRFPGCVAKIKIENMASLKLFEACGFKKKYYLLEK